MGSSPFHDEIEGRDRTVRPPENQPYAVRIPFSAPLVAGGAVWFSASPNPDEPIFPRVLLIPIRSDAVLADAASRARWGPEPCDCPSCRELRGAVELQ